MIRFFPALLLALSLAACGVGADSERAPRDPQLDLLFAQLQSSEDSAAAAALQERIERRWMQSGSPTVDALLERAAAASAAGDPELAVRFLDQASDLAPNYAEPWRRRAGIAYDSEDYAGAITAIQETLKREPRHFEALFALGMIYEELGQERSALEAFRAVLAVNPYHERARNGVARLEPRLDGREA